MPKYTGDDIYCDLIIPRKIDIQIIKETDRILAYRHTKPNWPTHIVVIPKKHIPSLIELDTTSELAQQLFKVVQEIANDIKKEKGSCRVITNLGNYQDSKHLHLHISEGKPLHY